VIKVLNSPEDKRPTQRIAASIVMLAIGIAMVSTAIALEASSAPGQLLIATGTTFIAAPLITALLQFFNGDPVQDLHKELGRISLIAGQASDAGVSQIFGQRADIPTETFESLARLATNRILILSYAMEFLADSPTFLEDLGFQAQKGLDVRILLGDPSGTSIIARDEEESSEGSIPSRIQTTLIRARREMGSNFTGRIRLFDAPLYASIYLFDNDAVICSSLFGQRGSRAPSIVARAPGPIFDSYFNHFEDLWALGAEAKSDSAI
jgi:hypothetical protein